MDMLFCKVIGGKSASKKVYEDDKVYASQDINPKRRRTCSFPQAAHCRIEGSQHRKTPRFSAIAS